MLNPFPDFLSYALLAPFLFRVVLGLLYFRTGVSVIKKGRAKMYAFPKMGPSLSYILGILTIVGSLMLFAGLLTQVAALFFTAVLFVSIVYQAYSERKFEVSDLEFLILIMTLSLLFTGAGFYAFDIPL